MANHVLARNPVETVTIDGEDYELELGNYTVALDIKEWADELQGFRSAASDPCDRTDAIASIAVKGLAIVAHAFGDEAAERLMGGGNRLNIIRLVSLMGIILQEAASARSMEAQAAAIMSFAETGDED